jgi:hypothetical protein
MNERIKELEKQCWDNQTNHLDTEKFAELIVEEFRGVLSEEYRKTPLECCGHFLRADEAIAKHFYGVK